jgi:chromosome segregation ATPase
MATLDTLKLTKSLEGDGGMPRRQAEAIATGIAEAISDGAASKDDLKETEAKLTSDIATLRTDLKETEAKLTAEIAALRTDLKETEAKLTAEIAALRSEMKIQGSDLLRTIGDANGATLRWVIGIVGFQTAALIGSAFALAHVFAAT